METVSIIDDDENSNMFLSVYLEEKWKVTTFEDWEEALSAYEKDPPDLILLDISLPGIEGTEVLKKIRQMDGLKRVKVIALTGYSLPKDRDKFLKQGFDDYIAKPVTDMSLFINKIEKCLR